MLPFYTFNAILEKTVFRRRIRLLEEKKFLYSRISGDEDIVKYQLKKLKETWRQAMKCSAFYRYWQKKHSLPVEIESLEEFSKFPVITKSDIQAHQELIFNGLVKYRVTSTGGSTGEPVKFPTSKSEKEYEYTNTYLGRFWWGIDPLDKILLFWGHSHLFGNGIKGRVANLRRYLSDLIINTYRLDAYNMSPETVGKYYSILVKKDPEVMIGYTSTIYKLMKYMDEMGLKQYSSKRLKGVIMTSELVTRADIHLVESLLGIPAIVEYGMAETGVLAYSHYSPYKLEVFWDHFLLTGSEDHRLKVSTLYPRIFPLINYDTSDLSHPIKTCGKSILGLSLIKGRAKQELLIRTKYKNQILHISGIMLVHILKGYPGVYGVSFQQLINYRIKIFVESKKTIILNDIKNYFFKEIRKDYHNICENCIEFCVKDNLPKTLSGKEYHHIPSIT